MLIRVLVMTVAVLAGTVAMVHAVPCDTHNQCMTNGMCMPDGTCQGTPLNSGSCDFPSDALCMTNGHCSEGACIGEPAAAGSSCSGGCGTCQEIFPGVPFLQCTVNPERLGQSCDTTLGLCFVGKCQQIGPIVQCFPTLKECPDTDHNPCTTDSCNPATGMCEHSNQPPCVPQCEVCSPTSGCQPANLGAACDPASTECPVASSCQVLVGRGLCLPGTPSSTLPTPTPTPSPSPLVESPTPTMPSGPCVGDCNHSGAVKGDDLLVGMTIGLGEATLDACDSLDVNGDGAVRVDEEIRGVINAANGCPL